MKAKEHANFVSDKSNGMEHHVPLFKKINGLLTGFVSVLAAVFEKSELNGERYLLKDGLITALIFMVPERGAFFKPFTNFCRHEDKNKFVGRWKLANFR